MCAHSRVRDVSGHVYMCAHSRVRDVSGHVYMCATCVCSRVRDYVFYRRAITIFQSAI